MDEMSQRFTGARETNQFCATIMVMRRCSRKVFQDVSLLDFHSDKFQLRGIGLTKKRSLARAPAKIF